MRKLLSLTFTVVTKDANGSFEAASFTSVKAAKECAGATRFTTGEFVAVMVNAVILREDGTLFHNSYKVTNLSRFLNEPFTDWRGGFQDAK